MMPMVIPPEGEETE